MKVKLLMLLIGLMLSICLVVQEVGAKTANNEIPNPYQMPEKQTKSTESTKALALSNSKLQKAGA